MEDFAAAVEELSRGIEQRQRRLRVAVDVENRRCDSLRTLLQRMQGAKGAFDHEDLKAVQDEIARREAALERLQHESRAQETVRREKEELFLQLHSTLHTRTRVLEDLDKSTAVLHDHEQLLQFFADKQLQLSVMLRSKMQELVHDAQAPLAD